MNDGGREGEGKIRIPGADPGGGMDDTFPPL